MTGRGRALLVATLAHLALIAGCAAAWRTGAWPVCLLLWPPLAWLGHAALTRLHEAVHSMLLPSRTWNEVAGIAIGTLAFTPMSVYRHVHARHHAWLGGLRDPEFVPYNRPGTPRALRRAYAWAELVAGVAVTPALYSLRTARAWRELRRDVRRRLALEWALLAVAWITIPIVARRHGGLDLLAVAYLVPAWLTGTLQTLRKFTEHLGMAGDTITAMTRTVVYRGRLGRLLSRTQLHVDHHGTHHRWPRIPWDRLPEATPLAYPGLHGAWRSHAAATRDALRHLRDPWVGPQWARQV
ncbi:MAG: fatty acid desaturase [Planctomycetes bacterium]|nr:fatty acid desaturase [Planctomycetota bacterium]